MKLPPPIEQMLQQEQVNFFLTNRIPRRLLTRFMGWFSRIEQPLVRDASIATFALFAGDLHLGEARKTSFTSLHDCFVRELKDGARPIAPDRSVLTSPCDGIVGAIGTIHGTELLQAKGSAYGLDELIGDRRLADRYRSGRYVTLRLTSNMYHRFHAPCDCRIEGATYISGDAWNVNPIALDRIARLYCRNERAVVHARLDETGQAIAIVAVGSILVGTIQLNFVSAPLAAPETGSVHLRCTAFCRKGDELGYFHYGSTIIVLAADGLDLCEHLRPGTVVRMGEPLLRRREYAGPA
jgi:phosphatidylserine decarboxylase